MARPGNIEGCVGGNKTGRQMLVGMFVIFFCCLRSTSGELAAVGTLLEGAVAKQEASVADVLKPMAEGTSSRHTVRTLLASRRQRYGFKKKRIVKKDAFLTACAAAWHTFQQVLKTNVGVCNKNMKVVAGGNFKDILTLARKAYEKKDKHLAGIYLNRALSDATACLKDLTKGRQVRSKGTVNSGIGQLQAAIRALSVSKPKPKPRPVARPRTRKPPRTGGRGNTNGGGNPVDACWIQSWRSDRTAYAGCAIGYGANPGGKYGKPYTVTDDGDPNEGGYSFSNPKPGTLRYGMKLAETGSYWITFAHDMTIRLKQEILVRSDTTIDGRGSKVEVTGGQFTIKEAKNVIISNLIIHDVVPQNTIYGADRSKGDCIYVFSSHHIWLDHLTLHDCWGEYDGGIPQAKLIGVIHNSYAVTISNTRFSHAMFTVLLGASDRDNESGLTVTIALNYFGPNLNQRQPRTRQGKFHVVNNYYFKWGDYAIGGSNKPNILSENNVFFAPDNSRFKRVTSIIDPTSGDPKYPWGENAQWQSSGDLFLNGAYFLDGGGKSLGDGIFNPPYDTSWVIPANAVKTATDSAGWLEL